MTTPTPTIIRLTQVLEATGNSKSTIYLRINQGLWPKPVKIGPRSSGWPLAEISALNSARIAGKSDDEIRQLVVKLLEARHEG